MDVSETIGGRIASEIETLGGGLDAPGYAGMLLAIHARPDRVGDHWSVLADYLDDHGAPEFAAHLRWCLGRPGFFGRVLERIGRREGTPGVYELVPAVGNAPIGRALSARGIDGPGARISDQTWHELGVQRSREDVRIAAADSTDY